MVGTKPSDCFPIRTWIKCYCFVMRSSPKQWRIYTVCSYLLSTASPEPKEIGGCAESFVTTMFDICLHNCLSSQAIRVQLVKRFVKYSSCHIACTIAIELSGTLQLNTSTSGNVFCISRHHYLYNISS